MSALSDYLENKLIDFILRGQPFNPPATTYVALLVAAPSDAGGGMEAAGGGYVRVAIPGALASWAGTQAAGATVTSSGTSGTTSNNVAITFPAPTTNWGDVTHFGVYDAPSGGNLLFWGALTSSKYVSGGGAAPSFAPGQLNIQIDN